jgi:hypothetical protein
VAVEQGIRGLRKIRDGAVARGIERHVDDLVGRRLRQAHDEKFGQAEAVISAYRERVASPSSSPPICTQCQP